MILESWRSNIDWPATLRSVFHGSPQEDPVIDGLRGMSSLAIVLFHSFYGVMFLLKSFDRVSTFIAQLPPWLQFLANTDKAVDVFFMVSGYLMGGALFREMSRTGTIQVRRFYLKRIFRIYPLFLLGIAFYALGNPKQSLKNLIYNLLFIDNFKMKTIIPVGWSLSIEMQFYLILPFLVFLLWRLRESQRLPFLGLLFASSFFAVALTGLAVPVTYETPFYLFHPDIVDPARFLDVIYYQTHTRFGPLVLGLIWAWLRHREDTGLAPPKSISPFWALSGILLAMIWAFFPVYRQDSWFYANFSPALNLICHSVHRGLFCLGIFMAARFAQAAMRSRPEKPPARILARGINKFLAAGVWRPFSQVVFPVYLFHFPMVAIAGALVFQTVDPGAVTSVSLASLAGIFIVASSLALGTGIVLHGLVERPLILAGSRFLQRS